MKFLNKEEHQDKEKTGDAFRESSSTSAMESMIICEECFEIETTTVCSISPKRICLEDSEDPLEEPPLANHNILSDDPGLWPERINSDLANTLVTRGPAQTHNHFFPTSKDGRKFSCNYYYRHLPNSEKINRD